VSSPYRVPAPPPPEPPPRASHPDRELLPVFGLIWLVSVLHVGNVLQRGSAFGVEDTLAALSVFLLPALVKGPIRQLVHRGW
jgi:hypothetical protein